MTADACVEGGGRRSHGDIAKVPGICGEIKRAALAGVSVLQVGDG